MRFFQKLGEVDVAPLAHQLIRNPQLWNADNFRTSYPGTPHQGVDDILIRFSDTATAGLDSEVIGDSGLIWQPASKLLTAVKSIALNVMRAVDGYDLGRVIISRVKPGGKIQPHADNKGDYVNAGWRYHIVIQGLPGSLYHCGNETVNMKTGEIWWFDHLSIHAIENNSADDRIHLMVDCRIWEEAC